MGRLNNLKEQEATLQWAEEGGAGERSSELSNSNEPLMFAFRDELRMYFALCGLARNKNASTDLTGKAMALLYRTRVRIELRMRDHLFHLLESKRIKIGDLFTRPFYGISKKQGISVRMPLWTCQPTELCDAACYAHDALDAAPTAVTRGVTNGVIAFLYEAGNPETVASIAAYLEKQTRAAIRNCLIEVGKLTNGWTRQPRIRFAHVGEMAAYVDFSNFLARRVYEISEGRVVCVVYTRHANSRRLSPELWVINFTLDQVSGCRRGWIPDTARVVYSAFKGLTSSEAEVNFLEHHRWIHTSPNGIGVVCPATMPQAQVRTCDGNRCDRCFRWTSRQGLVSNHD